MKHLNEILTKYGHQPTAFEFEDHRDTEAALMALESQYADYLETDSEAKDE